MPRITLREIAPVSKTYLYSSYLWLYGLVPGKRNLLVTYLLESYHCEENEGRADYRSSSASCMSPIIVHIRGWDFFWNWDFFEMGWNFESEQDLISFQARIKQDFKIELLSIKIFDAKIVQSRSRSRFLTLKSSRSRISSKSCSVMTLTLSAPGSGITWNVEGLIQSVRKPIGAKSKT